jgi:hypothetical protein
MIFKSHKNREFIKHVCFKENCVSGQQLKVHFQPVRVSENGLHATDATVCDVCISTVPGRSSPDNMARDTYVGCSL